MKKILITLSALLAIAIPATGFLFWIRMPRNLVDDTPLPQGPISRPEIEAQYSTSRLGLGVRVNLETLEKAVNRLPAFPYSSPVSGTEGSGTVSRSHVKFRRAGLDRLGLDGTVRFDGKLEGPLWTSINRIRGTYDGSSVALKIKDNWEPDPTPDVKVKLTEVVTTGAPDSIAKWAANKWVIPGLTQQAGQLPLPKVRTFAEQVWKSADVSMWIHEDPPILVCHRPVRAYLGGPEIDESSNSLVFSIGLEMRAWCSLGSGPEPGFALKSDSLPPLARQRVRESATDLRIPLIIRLKDAAPMFEPQTIPLEGGRIEIRSLELADKDGALHARLKVHFDHSGGFRGLLPKASEGTLVISARPSCDPNTGELRLNELKFTPKSSSILVNRVGTDSARILQDKLEALVPVFSGWLVNRMETELNTKAAVFLRSQIAAWANANPDFKEIIGATRPHVGNIRVRPIRFITNNGHLILVLSANSELGLSID